MSGAGMSSCGPMNGAQLGGEAARDARQLVLRELARVAAHAALRAAVRQPQQRALPGHPHRERRALAEVDGVVVADAALRRAEHRRVLHPVGRERAVRAVVHPTGRVRISARSGERSRFATKSGMLRELERVVELGQRLLVERRVPLEPVDGLCDLGHGRRLAPKPGQTASDPAEDGERPRLDQPRSRPGTSCSNSQVPVASSSSQCVPKRRAGRRKSISSKCALKSTRNESSRSCSPCGVSLPSSSPFRKTPIARDAVVVPVAARHPAPVGAHPPHVGQLLAGARRRTACAGRPDAPAGTRSAGA